MKDNETAAIALIKHITRRLDEFLYEYPMEGETLTMPELQTRFSRWLRVKEAPVSAIKHGLIHGEGIIAQQAHAEDIIDEESATLGFVKFFANGRIGLMWLPQLFTIPDFLCDELRDDLIKLLRFHAGKLEDRSLDERMKECAGKMGMGAA